MKLNKKGISLVELIIVIVIFSMIMVSISTIVKTLSDNINKSNIETYMDVNNGIVLNDMNLLLKDTDIRFSVYSYDDILSDKEYYDAIDTNKNIKTENIFRKELKDILEKNGIKKENGRIYGIIDDGFAIDGNGIKFQELSEKEKNTLIDKKLCKQLSINECLLYNNVLDINENFSLLVGKKNNLVFIYMIKKGNLYIESYNINNDINSNNNLKFMIFDKYYDSKVKFTKFQVSGISKNFTFNIDNNTNYYLSLLTNYCYFDYNNNNLNTSNLYCR